MAQKIKLAIKRTGRWAGIGFLIQFDFFRGISILFIIWTIDIYLVPVNGKGKP